MAELSSLSGDKIHEKSKPIFLEKKNRKKYHEFVVCRNSDTACSALKLRIKC